MFKKNLFSLILYVNCVNVLSDSNIKSNWLLLPTREPDTSEINNNNWTPKYIYSVTSNELKSDIFLNKKDFFIENMMKNINQTVDFIQHDNSTILSLIMDYYEIGGMICFEDIFNQTFTNQ